MTCGTQDGGLSWLAQPTIVQGTLRAVGAFTATATFAVGDGGTIMMSANGNQQPSSWHLVGNHPSTVDFYDAAFSWLIGIAVGTDGSIYHTVNSGDHPLRASLFVSLSIFSEIDRPIDRQTDR